MLKEHSQRAGGEADEEIHIVGLDLCFMCRFVADGRAASFAAVRDDKALFVVGLTADRAQDAAAGIGAVARQNVDVQRAKAKGAVIARSVSEGKHLFAAAHADKSAIVFLKSLRFHKKFLS